MLNEDKVRQMTRLAVFETEKGRQADIASHYYKNDYISYHLIWTAIASTFAYMLIVGLFVFCRMEYYINHLQQIKVMSVAVWLIGGYIGFLVLFEVVGFCIYRKRYKKAQKYLEEYCRELKELEKIYNNEHLRQTKATILRSLNLEGTVPNDKFTGI